LLPGASVSQDVKCFTVGHRLMSRPHSPMSTAFAQLVFNRRKIAYNFFTR